MPRKGYSKIRAGTIEEKTTLIPVYSILPA